LRNFNLGITISSLTIRDYGPYSLVPNLGKKNEGQHILCKKIEKIERLLIELREKDRGKRGKTEEPRNKIEKNRGNRVKTKRKKK